VGLAPMGAVGGVCVWGLAPMDAVGVCVGFWVGWGGGLAPMVWRGAWWRWCIGVVRL